MSDVGIMLRGIVDHVALVDIIDDDIMRARGDSEKGVLQYEGVRDDQLTGAAKRPRRRPALLPPALLLAACVIVRMANSTFLHPEKVAFCHPTSHFATLRPKGAARLCPAAVELIPKLCFR